MPIIVKPLNNLDSPGNPLNRPSDGFDPTIPYQMIPLGQSREMVVQTGDFKADMNLTIPDISSMSNFRILRQSTPNLFPLPGPGVPVRTIALPERSVVQFTLAGRSLGITVLEGRDRPGQGAPPLQPLKLVVSVKGNQQRKFAVCYVFDRINRDVGARRDFAGHLAEVNKIFNEQANFSIVNIDGPAASTLAARTITLNGTSGKVFDMRDNDLLGRVIDGFDARFPGVAAKIHCVVFVVQVPIRDSNDQKARILGFSFQGLRKSTRRPFSILLVGPQDPPRKSTSGGRQPSQVSMLRHTMAHEIGHSFGLDHDPVKKKLPPELLGTDVNPIFFTSPQLFNLMFPNNFLQSDRINGVQVEVMHRVGPQFRQEDV